jgi:hypothetical protein
MQMELVNIGTPVGSMDGIRSAHLSGGVDFTWNVRRTIGLLTGAGFSCVKTLIDLFCKGSASGGWKLRGKQCDSVDPLSLVIKCLGGGGTSRGT